MQQLQNFIKSERVTKEIYPESSKTFAALKATPYASIKVVILGQDPYHTPGVADGLAFSSGKFGYCPPSLENILNEVYRNVNEIPIMRQDKNPFTGSTRHYSLNKWATEEGVLLLNTCLTVQKAKPESHTGKGWEKFTTAVLKKCNDHPEPVVFMLWGAKAKVYAPLITNPKHLILEAPHPAADAYGNKLKFAGCRHFYQAFMFLYTKREKGIVNHDFKNKAAGSDITHLPIRWLNV